MQQLIDFAIKHPKQMFAVDGLGALFSAFLLGIVLVHYESVFGMPREVLYILATFPCAFFLFDMISYSLLTSEQDRFLRMIAIANALYCLISLGFVVSHSDSLTILGYIYFFSEIILVMTIAYVEWTAARRLGRDTAGKTS